MAHITFARFQYLTGRDAAFGFLGGKAVCDEQDW
jgi:hypothetical protein